MVRPSRKNGPFLYAFDPDCEAQAASGRPGRTPSRQVRLLREDLESLPLFLCGPDDWVWVRRKPDPGFLARLREAGFDLPGFVEYPLEQDELEQLRQQVRALRPWGWSPESARLARRLFPGGAVRWSERMRLLYSKGWSVEQLRAFLRIHPEEWLCGEEAVGRGCRDLDEVKEQVELLWRDGWNQVRMKGFFGASGQNQIRVIGGRLREKEVRWVQRILRKQGSVVVEPDLDKCCDLSILLEIGEEGEAEVAGWTRFFADSRGQYQGTVLGDPLAGLDPEVRDSLAGGGDGKTDRMQDLAARLARHLAEPMKEAGYVGPVGIDALVYRQAGRLRVKPIVEINPRFTMGRVALVLSARLDKTSVGVWLILNERKVRAAGYADAGEFARQVERRHPLERAPGSGQIRRGALFTTDPRQARGFLTLLIADASLEACSARMADLGLRT